MDTDGKKTYNVGDKIAVVYTNTSGETVKAESEPLTVGDITGSGKSAKFTVTLTNPDKDADVTYIYPAYMAKEDGTVNYDALYNEQDGTLATLGSKFDYCTYTGAWNEEKLPTATLANQLVICEYTLKNSDGSEELNANVTTMTISDGTNVYIINRTAGAGSIYVVIKPTTSANINYTATTNDGKVWTKSVTEKTYGAGEWCPLGLKMTLDTDMIPGLFSVSASKKVYFSKGNLQYTKSTSTWSFMDHQYSTVETTGSVVTDYGNKDVVSLFGWGTSNQTIANYGSAYQPWSTNTTAANYGPSGTYNLTDTYANGDWGVNMGSGWRTLTMDEWAYVFGTNSGDQRSGATVDETSNARYTEATINTDGTGVKGIILFPDGATFADTEATWGTINGNSAWTTTCTESQWSALEAKGCVFLPAAGYRNGSSVSSVGSYGGYWSSTAYYTSNAYYVDFYSGSLSPASNYYRYYGFSVRLVRDVVAP